MSAAPNAGSVRAGYAAEGAGLAVPLKVLPGDHADLERSHRYISRHASATGLRR